MRRQCLCRLFEARTARALDEALTQAIKLVTRADIHGWFGHCGYSLARK